MAKFYCSTQGRQRWVRILSFHLVLLQDGNGNEGKLKMFPFCMQNTTSLEIIFFSMIFCTSFPLIFSKQWGTGSRATQFLLATLGAQSHCSYQVANNVREFSILPLTTECCFEFHFRSQDGNTTVRNAEPVSGIVPKFWITFSGQCIFWWLFLCFLSLLYLSYLIMVTSVT